MAPLEATPAAAAAAAGAGTGGLSASSSLGSSGLGLFSRLKSLQRQLEFLNVQESFIRDEQKNLKREFYRAREELRRIQSVPLVIGQFLELLSLKEAIVSSTAGSSYVVRVLSTINKELLKTGSSVALHRHSHSVVDVLPPEADSTIQTLKMQEKPDISYSDVGGLDVQKQEIREAVELPLKCPEFYEQIGIEPPTGVLLYGPPGTGKTMLAKAVANNTQATFIRVVGSEFVQKYLGEGPRMVRDVFRLKPSQAERQLQRKQSKQQQGATPPYKHTERKEALKTKERKKLGEKRVPREKRAFGFVCSCTKAREHSPSIVFIDEVDAIATKRFDAQTGADREVQRILLELLNQMDGFDQATTVKVIMATNRADTLDPALLRPGRLDRKIEFPLPDRRQKRLILQTITAKMNLSEEVDLEDFVSRPEKVSAADIAAICQEAGMQAVRKNRYVVLTKDFEKGWRTHVRKHDREFDFYSV